MIFGALGELALGEIESNGDIRPLSIASAEAFGTATVTSSVYALFPVEIASTESFGTPSLVMTISPSSIESAEAFGTPWVAQLYTYLPISRL